MGVNGQFIRFMQMLWIRNTSDRIKQCGNTASPLEAILCHLMFAGYLRKGQRYPSAAGDLAGWGMTGRRR